MKFPKKLHHVHFQRQEKRANSSEKSLRSGFTRNLTRPKTSAVNILVTYTTGQAHKSHAHHVPTGLDCCSSKRGTYTTWGNWFWFFWLIDVKLNYLLLLYKPKTEIRLDQPLLNLISPANSGCFYLGADTICQDMWSYLSLLLLALWIP